MSASPDWMLIGVVAVAFVVGYGIITGMMTLLERSRQRPPEAVYTPPTADASPPPSTPPPLAHGAAARHSEEELHALALELEDQYTVDSIREAHGRLVAQYHPDVIRHLGPEYQQVAALRMRQIAEAFEFFKRKYGFH